MPGVKSVRRDQITDADLVEFVRRWSRNNRVTTRRIADFFGWSSMSSMRERLGRIACLTHETLPGCGNVWKVADE